MLKNSKLRGTGSFSHIFNTDKASIREIVAENMLKTPVIEISNNKLILKNGQQLILPENEGNKGDILINDGDGRLYWGKNERIVDLLTGTPIESINNVDTNAVVNDIMGHLMTEKELMKNEIQDLVDKAVGDATSKLKYDQTWNMLEQQNNHISEPSPLTLPRTALSLPPPLISTTTTNIITNTYVVQGIFTIPSSIGTGIRVFLPLSMREGKGSRDAQPVGISPYNMKPSHCYMMRVSGKGIGLSYSLGVEKRNNNQNIIVGSSYASGNMNSPLYFKFQDSSGQIDGGDLFYMVLTAHTGDPGTPMLHYTMVFEKTES